MTVALLLGMSACQLSACQLSGSQSGGPAIGDSTSIAQGTQRVVINYLIAHGMAESYVMSGRATPANLLDLVRFDHSALVAIRGHEADPGWTSLQRASNAVRALMDYTTAMDGAAPPTSPRAASR